MRKDGVEADWCRLCACGCPSCISASAPDHLHRQALHWWGVSVTVLCCLSIGSWVHCSREFQMPRILGSWLLWPEWPGHVPVGLYRCRKETASSPPLYHTQHAKKVRRYESLKERDVPYFFCCTRALRPSHSMLTQNLQLPACILWGCRTVVEQHTFHVWSGLSSLYYFVLTYCEVCVTAERHLVPSVL
jgi:hypothetical protein